MYLSKDIDKILAIFHLYYSDNLSIFLYKKKKKKKRERERGRDKRRRK